MTAVLYNTSMLQISWKISFTPGIVNSRSCHLQTSAMFVCAHTNYHCPGRPRPRFVEKSLQWLSLRSLNQTLTLTLTDQQLCNMTPCSDNTALLI